MPVPLHHWELYTSATGNLSDGVDTVQGPALEINEGVAQNTQVHLIAPESRCSDGDANTQGTATSLRGHAERAADGGAAGTLFRGDVARYGAMPDYAAQVAPADRWAVAAYIRALQLSQNAKPAECRGARVEKLAESRARGAAGDFAGVDAAGDGVYGTPSGTDNAIPPPVVPGAKGGRGEVAANRLGG